MLVRTSGNGGIEKEDIMKKRLLVILLSVAVLFTFMPATAFAAEGWVNQNGGWMYEYDDGSHATGWLLLDDYYYYYLDPATGLRQTGWKKINGNWYYFAKNGEDEYASEGEMYDQGLMIVGSKPYYFGW